MNNVYNLIMNGAADPLEKVLMMVLFMLMFEGLISIISELIKMGGGR